MKALALKQVSYDPSIFTAIETLDDAVRIIVTPEAGLTSAQRWQAETPCLLELIERWLRPKAMVVDYGCGIGRLAKPLIEKHHCTVIGVDISPNMRALAASYVESHDFAAIHPAMLAYFGSDFEFAMAIWTLQHVLDVRQEVTEIVHCLRDGARLFVVNNVGRVVPTTGGWVDDGVDVRAILKDHFTEIEYGQLSEDIAPGAFKDSTFWAVYQK